MTIARVELICKDCGKTFEMTRKFHNSRQAQEWEDFMRDAKDYRCRDCHFKAENKRKAGLVKDCELVPLEGSEKQIAWAEGIRGKFVYDALAKHPSDKFWELVNAKTSASWWIDCRDMGLTDIVAKLKK